ncbi:hypothetical protein JNJ66_01715 [Candidatus Saccharibacteria bacterium]|nr:hypothetical protein [Candidatus Saccharibacteria bacterium]
MMLKKLVNLFVGDTSTVPNIRRSTRKYSERDLLRKESLIGRQLFGEVPQGHQREFFCLDERTWIWYEKWIDPATKKEQEQTTRYELHTNGIIKIQAGQPYKVIEGEELTNLVGAMRLYNQRVSEEVYHLDPATNQPLTA